jgi:hypothetical protein
VVPEEAVVPDGALAADAVGDSDVDAPEPVSPAGVGVGELVGSRPVTVPCTLSCVCAIASPTTVPSKGFARAVGAGNGSVAAPALPAATALPAPTSRRTAARRAAVVVWRRGDITRGPFGQRLVTGQRRRRDRGYGRRPTGIPALSRWR